MRRARAGEASLARSGAQCRVRVRRTGPAAVPCSAHTAAPGAGRKGRLRGWEGRPCVPARARAALPRGPRWAACAGPARGEVPVQQWPGGATAASQHGKQALGAPDGARGGSD